MIMKNFFRLSKPYMIISVLLFLFILIEVYVRMNPGAIFLLGDYISTIMISDLEFAKEKLRDRVPIKFDEELGYVLKPGKRFRVRTHEYFFEAYFSPITIDGFEIGIRDNIINLDDIFAVVIGDSFAFCYGVSDSECFVEILQNKIKKEVVNLGVFGYGSY